jgi:hypothetical protein
VREIRLHSSEGGAAGVATGRPYPYSDVPGPRHNAVFPELWQRGQAEVQTTVETPRFVGRERRVCTGLRRRAVTPAGQRENPTYTDEAPWLYLHEAHRV